MVFLLLKLRPFFVAFKNQLLFLVICPSHFGKKLFVWLEIAARSSKKKRKAINEWRPRSQRNSFGSPTTEEEKGFPYCTRPNLSDCLCLWLCRRKVAVINWDCLYARPNSNEGPSYLHERKSLVLAEREKGEWVSQDTVQTFWYKLSKRKKSLKNRLSVIYGAAMHSFFWKQENDVKRQRAVHFLPISFRKGKMRKHILVPTNYFFMQSFKE